MPAIERAPAVFDPAPRRVSIRSAPAAPAGDGFTVLCGAAARRAIEKSGRKVAVLASGSLSHKLVANSEDIDRLAGEDAPDVAAMHGWRYDVFGADALALKAGRIALGVDGKRIKLLPA